MGTRGTSLRRSWARRAHPWMHALRWIAGGALVGIGALCGAFGTVAWLSVLRAPSVTVVLLSLLFLSATPLTVGLSLLWAGLSVLEKQMIRSRVRALPERELLDAAEEAATARAIALRLGVSDVRETERRLDDLVVRERLALDVTDEGELIYRASRRSRTSAFA